MSSDDATTTWAIRVTRRARADVQEAWEHFAATSDDANADAWQESIEEAIASLSSFPNRHPVAPEAALFGTPAVHRLLHRRTRAGVAYHIFYRLYGLTEMPADAPFVRIIAVRHAAASPMTEDEAQLIQDAEK